MAREGHQIDWRLCEERPRPREPPRDDACANVGVATVCVVWLTRVRRCTAARRHIASSYYSITRCFYRRDRRDRRRHSKQQHVAWHNKRPRLPTVPLNRNNAVCVIAKHPLRPARLRLTICLKSDKKNRRINHKIRSTVHEINSDVWLANSNRSVFIVNCISL